MWQIDSPGQPSASEIIQVRYQAIGRNKTMLQPESNTSLSGEIKTKGTTLTVIMAMVAAMAVAFTVKKDATCMELSICTFGRDKLNHAAPVRLLPVRLGQLAKLHQAASETDLLWSGAMAHPACLQAHDPSPPQTWFFNKTQLMSVQETIEKDIFRNSLSFEM